MPDADGTSQAESAGERRARLIEEIKERAYELVSSGDEVEGHSLDGDVFAEAGDPGIVCGLVYVS